MEYRYSTFKPNESKYAHELISSYNPKKYITKKQSEQKFFEAFKVEVDKLDDDGYLKNPYLYQLEGANLNYVATQVFLLANKIRKSGYELRLDNIASELDTLFGEFAKEVEKIYDNSQKGLKPPVEQLSKDIAYFYFNDILKPAVDEVVPTLNVDQ